MEALLGFLVGRGDRSSPGDSLPRLPSGINVLGVEAWIERLQMVA